MPRYNNGIAVIGHAVGKQKRRPIIMKAKPSFAFDQSCQEITIKQLTIVGNVI
jgi:hypothetical protein